MKNVILFIIGAILGALFVTWFYETDFEGYTESAKPIILNKDGVITESKAKSLYNEYFLSKKNREKFSKGQGKFRNKYKPRYFDVPSKVFSKMVELDPKGNKLEFRLIPGKTNDEKTDHNDLILLAVGVGGLPKLTEGNSISKEFYFFKFKPKESPTCPIECDLSNTDVPW